MSYSDGATTRMNEPVVAQTVALWRNRDYMLLWGGQLISSLGTGISLLAFPLLVLTRTNSPALAGGVSALRAIVYVFLGLPAGALIDRWDRKRTMIVCDIIRALALATIPVALVLGHLTILQVYLVAFIEGVMFVFFITAQTSCLPHVVSAEQLPHALSQNQFSIGISVLLGPLFSGILYGIGRELPFTADATSYVVSFLTLLFIKRPFQRERSTRASHLGTEIAEGLTWLWNQPIMRFMAFLTAGVYFVIVSGNLLLLVIAQHLHASSSLIGVIFTIGAGGYLLGTFLGPHAQRGLSFKKALIAIFWLMALLWSCFAVIPTPLLLGAVTAGIWMLLSIYDVLWGTYSVSVTPDKLRGRVSSTFLVLIKGFESLGPLVAGLSLQYWRIVPTVLLLTACLVVLAGAATLNAGIRHVGKGVS